MDREIWVQKRTQRDWSKRVWERRGDRGSSIRKDLDSVQNPAIMGTLMLIPEDHRQRAGAESSFNKWPTSFYAEGVGFFFPRAQSFSLGGSEPGKRILLASGSKSILFEMGV